MKIISGDISLFDIKLDVI